MLAARLDSPLGGLTSAWLVAIMDFIEIIICRLIGRPLRSSPWDLLTDSCLKVATRPVSFYLNYLLRCQQFVDYTPQSSSNIAQAQDKVRTKMSGERAQGRDDLMNSNEEGQQQQQQREEDLTGRNGQSSYYHRNQVNEQDNVEPQSPGVISAANDEDDEEGRTTESQTMMHILKANIGTGVLAMPMAFKHVGIWLGLLLMPVIGAICIHCMNILIQSGNELARRFKYDSLDYDQVAALGLACGPRWARRVAKHISGVITFLLMLTQLGACCVYILFAVQNIQEACLHLFGFDYPRITYLLAIFPVIFLTSCNSNLRLMARVSTLANCLQLFGLSIIFFDLFHFHTFSSDDRSANMVEGVAGNLRNGLPIFFGVAVYSFEGIGVVLPLVKEMENPRRIAGINGVLNTAMSCVALLYMTMGFFGYAKYGQAVESVITLNLPQGTLNEIVRLAYALAIGLSFSLQFYVPWMIVWPVIDEKLFYSYRQRMPRKKLEILSKLSAENDWNIHLVMRQIGDNNNNKQSSLNDFNSSAGRQYGSLEAEQNGRRTTDDQSNSEMAEAQWQRPSRSMRKKRKMVRYSLLFVGVLLTFVAAALIPRLDSIISLIGAGASSSLAIIFPAIIQLCTFWQQPEDDDDDDAAAHLHENQHQQEDESERLILRKQRQRRKLILWRLFVAKNLWLVKFGILGLITGTWISLRQLSDA